jgi:hypothetical protein
MPLNRSDRAFDSHAVRHHSRRDLRSHCVLTVQFIPFGQLKGPKELMEARLPSVILNKMIGKCGGKNKTKSIHKSQ